ncbi:hypothetical protein HanRHA438_Chr02g0060871 [Helianthus annuus]|nr:hypothetical protein HanRHA438_Chr02g0060871 [Helianthus annuus]
MVRSKLSFGQHYYGSKDKYLSVSTTMFRHSYPSTQIMFRSSHYLSVNYQFLTVSVRHRSNRHISIVSQEP